MPTPQPLSLTVPAVPAAHPEMLLTLTLDSVTVSDPDPAPKTNSRSHPLELLSSKTGWFCSPVFYLNPDTSKFFRNSCHVWNNNICPFFVSSLFSTVVLFFLISWLTWQRLSLDSRVMPLCLFSFLSVLLGIVPATLCGFLMTLCVPVGVVNHKVDTGFCVNLLVDPSAQAFILLHVQSTVQKWQLAAFCNQISLLRMTNNWRSTPARRPVFSQVCVAHVCEVVELLLGNRSIDIQYNI